MTVSARDIAAELRRRDPRLGLAKLHKLLYYVQGWHLAWTGDPAFEEQVEAWTNGPVVADLWREERYDSPRPHRPPRIDDRTLAVIDYVCSRYGQKSGSQLIQMTHTEDPWQEVSQRDDDTSFGTAEITPRAMRSWFEQDDEHGRLKAEAERLRQEHPVSFTPADPTPERLAAIRRARTGAVQQTRPA